MAKEKRKPKSLTDGASYELSLIERIGLLAVLPRQGDLISIRILRDLETELAPSETESKDARLQSNARGGTSWDVSKAAAITKKVPIGERAKELIVVGIGMADKQGVLDRQWLPLYERFLTTEDPSVNGHQERESEVTT